jgi:hypothetical protein
MANPQVLELTNKMKQQLNVLIKSSYGTSETLHLAPKGTTGSVKNIQVSQKSGHVDELESAGYLKTKLVNV